MVEKEQKFLKQLGEIPKDKQKWAKHLGPGDLERQARRLALGIWESIFNKIERSMVI